VGLCWSSIADSKNRFLSDTDLGTFVGVTVAVAFSPPGDNYKNAKPIVSKSTKKWNTKRLNKKKWKRLIVKKENMKSCSWIEFDSIFSIKRVENCNFQSQSQRNPNNHKQNWWHCTSLLKSTWSLLHCRYAQIVCKINFKSEQTKTICNTVSSVSIILWLQRSLSLSLSHSCYLLAKSLALSTSGTDELCGLYFFQRDP